MRYTDKQKPRMVDRRGGEGGRGEAWTMIKGIRDRGEQPPTGSSHLYGQNKKAARRAVDRGVWRKNCTENFTNMVEKR